MLALVIVVVTAAFFTGVVGLIVRFSGRAYDGQITEDLHNPVEYENPYPGWGARLFGANEFFERKIAEPPAVPLEQWSTSRSR